MKKYLLDTVNETDHTAGSKARRDIQTILEKNGYESLFIQVGTDKKQVLKEERSIRRQIHSLFYKMDQNSVVLVQYPWPTLSYGMAADMQKEASGKNIQLMVLIHDLNSVRTGSEMTKFYYDHYVKEIRFLDVFDAVICHNEKMKRYLVDQGIASEKIVSLELFDYLVSGYGKKDAAFQYVNYAGNLSREKSTFLYSLNALKGTAEWHLYGPGYEGMNDKRIHYEGSYPADDLASHITSGFGLVWDGTSADTCAGHFGRYMRINNPHKLSLYMACGIPVLVWDQAAVADFVRQKEVGYAVSSLDEAASMLAETSLDQYEKMRQNAEMEQAKVTAGWYTLQAVKKAEKEIQ